MQIHCLKHWPTSTSSHRTTRGKMQVRQTGPALITVHHHSIRSHADTSLQCTHEYNNINSERTTSLELASWHTLTDAFHIFIDTNELHCAYNTSYNKQWRQDTKRNCQNKHCSLTWRSRRRSPGLGLWHDCMYKQPGLLPSSASLIETNMSTTHASVSYTHLTLPTIYSV